MRFKIGDLVCLKGTEIEGVIEGVEHAEMYRVMFGDALLVVFREQLEYPFFDWSDKVKDKQKNLKFKSSVQHPAEKETVSRQKEMGVYLAFFPIMEKDTKETIARFRIYLINLEKEPLFFTYKLRLHSKTVFSTKGHALPFTNCYIQEISMEDMHLIPSFELKIVHDKEQAEIPSFLDEIKIRPKKLFDFLNQLEEGPDTYFQIPLEIDKATKMAVLKGIDIKIGQEKANLNPIHAIPKYVREIDLHIEKLKSDYEHLTNAAIIQIQIQAFEKALSIAIQNGQSDLTIIHGVGKGVLKAEIHKILSAEIYVRHFICDWSPKYGNGATQVFFN